MTKTKLLLIFVVGFLAVMLDVGALSTCGRLQVPAHIGIALFGLLLQTLGLWFVVRFLRGTDAKPGEDILSAGYYRYGLWRSKWVWAVCFVLAGVMTFAGAFVDEFKLGRKFWTCQTN